LIYDFFPKLKRLLFGIPLGILRGVKTHFWGVQNFWGFQLVRVLRPFWFSLRALFNGGEKWAKGSVGTNGGAVPKGSIYRGFTQNFSGENSTLLWKKSSPQKMGPPPKVCFFPPSPERRVFFPPIGGVTITTR